MDVESASLPRAARLLIWLSAAGLAVMVIAWLGFVLQQNSVAPAGIFSLVIGAAIGGATACIWRGLGLGGHFPAFAALIWALLAVIVQEQIAYRQYLMVRAEAMRQNAQLRAVFERTEATTPSFGSFVETRFKRNKAWWLADGVLTALAAVISAAVLLSRPRAAESRASS